MGNDISRPQAAATEPEAPSRQDSRTCADMQHHHQQESAPVFSLPGANWLLTPPPSGRPKRATTPEHRVTDARLITPPTSAGTPTNPPTPTLSPTLLGTPSSPLPSSHANNANSSTPSESPCSHCYRPIPQPQRPVPQQPQESQPPQPLRCGHVLCRHCLRAVLLLALSTDPFVPAACPACRGTAGALASPRREHEPSLQGEAKEDQPPEHETKQTSSSLAALPLAILGPAATPAEFLAYGLKLRESRTPPAARLYCHDKVACGMFLGGLAKPWMRTRVAVCPLCGARTCRRCGEKAHATSSVRGGGCPDEVVKGEGKGTETVEEKSATRRQKKMRLRKARGGA
ncbi:hypothetical protein VTJ83DRAFT_1942 [Remersonia thermophila]|uniref:RING-type domain-containing protein n=1 Tax=Remersonia thermophila TaxID=72144 RepID=A0ABR4DHB8_9PEZI